MLVDNTKVLNPNSKPKRVLVFKSNGEQIYSDTLVTYAVANTGAIAEEFAEEVAEDVVEEISEPTLPKATSEVTFERQPELISIVNPEEQLRKYVKTAIIEIDNLLEILERQKHSPGSMEDKISKAFEPVTSLNKEGLLDLLQSPAIHNLLGSLLGEKTTD